MWRSVFLTNKDAVLKMIGTFNEDLSRLTREIRRGILQIGQDSPATDFGRPHSRFPLEGPHAVVDEG